MESQNFEIDLDLNLLDDDVLSILFDETIFNEFDQMQNIDNSTEISHYEEQRINTNNNSNELSQYPSNLQTIETENKSEEIEDITRNIDNENPNPRKKQKTEDGSNNERHKQLRDTDLDSISKANTEKNTNYQTTWAVKTFKGTYLSLYLFKGLFKRQVSHSHIHALPLSIGLTVFSYSLF